MAGVRQCGLRFLPYRLADDTGMSVLHIVLRRFNFVWFSGFRQEIHGDFRLEDGIIHIFLALDGVWLPSLALSRRENAVCHEDTAYICAAFPGQGKQIDEPRNTGSSFIDLYLAV